MNDYFIPGLIVIVVAFWLYKSYQLIAIIGRIEKIKLWPSAKATIEWIHVEGETKPGKLRFLRALANKLIGTERFHFFAKFKIKGLEVGATRFSLFQRNKASHRIFARNIIRSKATEVDVFYNPDNPMESVILPPKMHRIRSDVMKHLFVTAMLNYAIIMVAFQ